MRVTDPAAVEREAQRVFREFQTTRGARILAADNADGRAYVTAVRRRVSELAAALLEEPWTDPH